MIGTQILSILPPYTEKGQAKENVFFNKAGFNSLIYYRWHVNAVKDTKQASF